MRARFRLLFVAVFCLVQPGWLLAQGKRDITVDDYFTQADIFQIAISHKGDVVAYTEGRWQKSTDDRKADLWVVPLKDVKESRRLTSDRASYRSPQWSAEGKWIYVLANRHRDGEKNPPWDGTAQVWRVASDGEPHPITQIAGGVEAFALCERSQCLLYVVHKEHQDEDFRALREKHSNVEYGQGVHKTSQVWKLDLGTWRSEKLIDAGRYIYELSISPDGKRLAMITAPDEKVASFEGKSTIDVWEDGKIASVPDDLWRKNAPSKYAWLEGLAWSGDSDKLAFNAIWDGYPTEIVIAAWAEGKVSAKYLPRPAGVHVHGYGSPVEWRGQHLFFLAEEKARVRLARYNAAAPEAKEVTVITPGDVVVEGFSVAKASTTVALNLATPQYLNDIYIVSVPKDASKADFTHRRLTKVNPQAESWKQPQLKIVAWKGTHGDTVEGVLELPHDYKAGKKVPLVLAIHGGPTTATYFKQQFWIYGRTLLPAKGYAVLCPNYRGSTGYGDKFTTDLIGHENDVDVNDILKGVDAMIEQGIADPDRLAVSGWSNGGYLTDCLIARTTRFKAAISGAGIVDAIMEFGGNDEPAFSIVFKQGFPWSNPEKYHKASSTYSLDKIRTPTLIHVGGNDERCPPSQSRLLFRALKDYLNVPTQLCVYPDEPHGLAKYSHRQAKMEWDLAWLERYLK